MSLTASQEKKNQQLISINFSFHNFKLDLNQIAHKHGNIGSNAAGARLCVQNRKSREIKSREVKLMKGRSRG